MKILAIRMARFGDIVLLLPALNLLKASIPGSHITFLTDHRMAPLAEMSPAIDTIMPLNRIAIRDESPAASLHRMYAAVRDVRRGGFDLAIDFHGFRETNLLAWLSGARKRIGLHRTEQSFLNFCFNMPPVHEDKTIHVGEMFRRVVEGAIVPTPISTPVLPSLAVPESSRHWAKANLPVRPFAALYVDAPTPRRIWPAERFAAVADFISSELDWDVVVVSGQEGAASVQHVQNAARIPQRIRGFANLSIPQLAALVETAQLWVSNDTGPMHLGPILNVPTLGLFSIGLPQHFRPTGVRDGYLLGNPIEEIAAAEAISRIQTMLSTVRPDFQH